jgi:hypothetical protein
MNYRQVVGRASYFEGMTSPSSNLLVYPPLCTPSASWQASGTDLAPPKAHRQNN